MPVNTKHPQYSEFIEDWQDCRLFYLGEKVVKEAGTHFLPRPEGATKAEYANYVQRAGFFPAMERTVAGLSGSIDRKDPTMVLPARIDYIRDNADANMATLRQFSKVVLDEVFITGRCGILCERDQKGNPPYLVLYPAENIINWVVDEEQRLTLVVLLEQFYEQSPTDEFSLLKRKRYRVLKLDEGRYIQRIYSEFGQEKIAQIGEDIEIQKAGIPLTEIPFVFCNVRSITAKIDKPPLLDLVRKNTEHYRVSADYANALYFTGNPILVARGVKKPKPMRMPRMEMQQNIAGDYLDYTEPDFNIALGSSRAVFIPKEGDIFLVECKGHGVNPNRDRANDIKLEMAVLGARLLEAQRTGVEAAETARLRQSGETSVLSNIVVNVSASIKKALVYLNQWQGGMDSGDEIEFMLNTDFVDVAMNPQLLTALSELVTKEYISWETFYYNLAAGELTIPGKTAEEERKDIELQAPMSLPDANDLSALNIVPTNQNQTSESNNQE